MSEKWPMVPGQVKRGATFSQNGRYRYTLRRAWGSGPFVVFVGLNPSTADAMVDDPTIRRCTRFARDWGYDGLVMLNLFAYRATNPRELLTVDDPVGIGNTEVLGAVCEQAALVIEAWGSFKLAADRGRSWEVQNALGSEVCWLARNRDGQPKHPLYIAADTRPVGGLLGSPATLPCDLVTDCALVEPPKGKT